MSLVLSIFAVLMIFAIFKDMFKKRETRKKDFERLLIVDGADSLALIIFLAILVFYIWTGLVIGTTFGFIGAIVLSVDAVYSFSRLVRMINNKEYEPAGCFSWIMNFASVGYLLYFILFALKIIH